MDSVDSEYAGGYRTVHDWERGGSISCTVAEAVATVKDVAPADLEPLQSAVDPDALDRIVASLDRSGAPDGEGHVAFAFDGCRVTVTVEGTVTVRRGSTDREGNGIATDEEFQAALGRLIREAEENGIDVDGGWACRDGSACPTWGIEIYEVDES